MFFNLSISGPEVDQFGPKPRHLTFNSDKALDITRAADSPNGTSTSVSGKAETFQFDFDHVFGPETSQVYIMMATTLLLLAFMTLLVCFCC